MKRGQRLAMILSAILMSAFLCHFSSLPPSAQADSRDLKQGVVKIIAEKGEKPKDTGAGIVVGVDEGTAFILTAYHVVEEAKKVEVVFFDKRYQKFAGELFDQYDGILDMAVIKVSPKPGEKLPTDLPDIPLGDVSKLKEREKISSIGHPLDNDWDESENTIKGLSYQQDARKFRFTNMGIERGCSGGPVLNQEGALIGMAISHDPIQAVAVKIDAALWILREEWRIPVTKLSGQISKPPVRREELANTINLQGMEFVLVKGGCFQMGDTFGDGYPDEKPVHEVCVNDFYVGKYEVTVGQFRQFVNATGRRTEAEKGDGSYYFTGTEWKKGQDINWKNPGFAQTDRHPVVCVSHNDAMAFAEWLSRKSGKTIRLPTEAEWEYAARSGGKKYKYSWGNGSPSANIADLSVKRQFPKWPWSIWEGYDDGYVYTAPVGTYQPNELGLYDMTGNVWEWCSDWYGEKYHSESPKENPQGPTSEEIRVIRGGSWDSGPGDVRAAYRFWLDRSARDGSCGFRLVLPPQ